MPDNKLKYVVELEADIQGFYNKLKSGAGIKELETLLARMLPKIQKEANKMSDALNEGLTVDDTKLKNTLSFFDGALSEINKKKEELSDYSKVGKIFITNFNNMQASVEKLTGKLDGFETKLSELSSAFDNLVNRGVTTSFAKLEASLGSFTGGLDTKIQKINRLRNDLRELTLKDYKLKIDDSELETTFKRLEKEVDALYDKEERTGKSQDIALNKRYAQMYAIEKRRKELKLPSLIGDVGEYNTSAATMKDWEQSINETAERIKTKLEKLEKDINTSLGASFAKIISEQISDINLRLTLNDEEKNKIVREINNFIQQLNSGTWSGLEKINLGAGAINTGFIELAKDDVEAKVKQMNDGISSIIEKTNEKINEATKSQDGIVYDTLNTRQKGVYNATQRYIESLKGQLAAYKKFQSEISGDKGKSLTSSEASDLYFYYQQLENVEYKRDLILQNTKAWREEMINALSIKGEEIKLDFDIEQSAKDSLFNNLQKYFEENQIDLNFKIDGGLIGAKVKDAIEGSGVTINAVGGAGGVANIDAQELASAFVAALMGETPTSKTDNQNVVNQKQKTQKVVYLDANDKFVEHMVNSVRGMIDYTQKDTNVAKKLKGFFKWHGFDLDSLSGKNSMEVTDALSKLITTHGNTLIEEFNEFISKNGNSKIATDFKNDLHELIRTYNIKQETVDSETKRIESIKVFSDFFKRASLTSGMRDVTNTKSKKWKAPTLEDAEGLRVIAQDLFKGNPRAEATLERFLNGNDQNNPFGLNGLINAINEASVIDNDADREKALKEAVEKFKLSTSDIYGALIDYINAFEMDVFLKGRKPERVKGFKGIKRVKALMDGDESKISDVHMYEDPSVNPIGAGRRSTESRYIYSYGYKGELLYSRPDQTDIIYKDVDVSSFNPKEGTSRKATSNEISGIKSAEEEAEKREAANKAAAKAEIEHIDNIISADEQLAAEISAKVKERATIRRKITIGQKKFEKLGINEGDIVNQTAALNTAKSNKASAQKELSEAQTMIAMLEKRSNDWNAQNQKYIDEIDRYTQWQVDPEKYAEDFNEKYYTPRIEAAQVKKDIEDRNAKIAQARIKKAQDEIDRYKSQRSIAVQSGDIDTLNIIEENIAKSTADLENAQRDLEKATNASQEIIDDINQMIARMFGDTATDIQERNNDLINYTKEQIEKAERERKQFFEQHGFEDPVLQYKKAERNAKAKLTRASNKVKQIESLPELQALALLEDQKQLSAKENALTTNIDSLEAKRIENKITQADIFDKDKTDADIEELRGKVAELDAKITSDQKEKEVIEKYIEDNYKKNEDKIDYTKKEQRTIEKLSFHNFRESVLSQIQSGVKPDSKVIENAKLTKPITEAIEGLFDDKAIIKMLSGDFGLDEFKTSDELNAEINKQLLDLSEVGRQKIYEFLLNNRNKSLNDAEDAAVKQLLSDEDVRNAIEKDPTLKNATSHDAKANIAIMDFYNKILTDGKEAAMSYLLNTINNLKKDAEKQSGKISTFSTQESSQITTLQTEVDNINAAKQEREKAYIEKAISRIQENEEKMRTLSDPKEIAVLAKENEDLLSNIKILNATYVDSIAALEEKIRENEIAIKNSNSEKKKAALSKQNEKLKSELDRTVQQINPLSYLSQTIPNNERERREALKAIDDKIPQRMSLLSGVRALLLDKISVASKSGESTESLEKELAAINAEMEKYSIYTQTISSNDLSRVFSDHKEDLEKYQAILSTIIKLEQEADLMRAKGASTKDLSSKYAEIDAKQTEREALLYNSLKKQQSDLLSSISKSVEEKESTKEFEDKLKLVNKQLVELELNKQRIQDSKIGGVLYNADITVVQQYNEEMRERIRLEQELLMIQSMHPKADNNEKDAQEVLDAKDALRKQKKRTEKFVNQAIEDSLIAQANDSARVQALEYLDNTQSAYDLALQKRAEINRRKRVKEDALYKLQNGENYVQGRDYREHRDAIKNKKVNEYIHSDKYQQDRDAGYKVATEKFFEYLKTVFDPATAEKILYEFTTNKDRANIGKLSESAGQRLFVNGSFVDENGNEKISIGKKFEGLYKDFETGYQLSEEYNNYKKELSERAKAEFQERISEDKQYTQLLINEINETSVARKQSIEAMTQNDELIQSEMQKVRNSVDFGKMQSDFANVFTKDVLSAFNSDNRKRMVIDLRKELKHLRNSGASQEQISSLQAKHDLFNADDEHFYGNIINRLIGEAKNNGANSKEIGKLSSFFSEMNPNNLKNVFSWFSGMQNNVFSNKMSEEGVLAEAKENLIAQIVNDTAKEVAAIKDTYNKKRNAIKTDIVAKIEQQLQERITNHVLNSMMNYINGISLIETEGQMADVQKQFKEIFSNDVYSLVDRYKEKLSANEDVGYIDGVNIKEETEKDLRAELSILEQLEKENLEEIAKIEAERNKAKSFGNIGRGEIVNAEVLKEQSIIENRLTIEKQKQADIIAEINRLENENASTTVLAPLYDKLEAENKMVDRLQNIVNNRDILVGLQEEARRDEKAENSWSPEKQKIWYEHRLELARANLGSNDPAVLDKANKDIEIYNEKLRKLTEKYSNQLAEETQKSLIDKLLDKFAGRLSGIGQSGSGGNISFEGSDLATESTLRAIFDILSGGGEAGKALDAYKDGLASEMAKNTPTSSGGVNTPTSSDSGTKKDKKKEKEPTKTELAKEKLNAEGKKLFDSMSKAAEEIRKTNREKDSKTGKNVIKFTAEELATKIKESVGKMSKLSPDSEAYLKEQARLGQYFNDYRTKVKPGAKQEELIGSGALNGIDKLGELLVTSINARLQTLLKLNYGADGGLSRDKNKKSYGQKKKTQEVNAQNAEKKSTPKVSGSGQVIPQNILSNIGAEDGLARETTLNQILVELEKIVNGQAKTGGKGGVKTPVEVVFEELKKMAQGSAMDKKERLAYMDWKTGAMSPSLAGNTHTIDAGLIKTLVSQFGPDKGYKTQIHTHADSKQSWFSNGDLDTFKGDVTKGIKGIWDADLRKQVVLTKDTITVLDLTMVETAENAAKAIDILKKAKDGVLSDADRKKFEALGARYQGGTFEALGPKGVMDLISVEPKAVGAKEQKDPFDAIVEKYHRKIAYAESAQLLTPEQLESWNVVRVKLEQAKLALDDTEESANALSIAQEEVARTGENLAKAAARNEKALSGTNEMRSAERQRDKILGVGGQSFLGTDENNQDLLVANDGAPKAVYKYVEAYNGLIQAHSTYVKNNEISNPKIQTALKQQAAGVQVLGSKLNRAITQSQKLQELAEQSKELTYYNPRERKDIRLGDSTPASIENMKNLRGAMEAYAKDTLKADIAHSKFSNTNKTLQFQLRTSKDTVSDMVVAYDDLTKSFYMYQKAERESLTGLKGFLNGMKGKMKGIIQYAINMTSLYRVVGILRQGITYIKEIDAALVELRKVTDETEETYAKFLDTASDTAYRLGSTLVEVTNATAEFAKLGYSMEMAAEMGEAALVYANVGDGIGSAQEAADSIISTLKGFKMEAEEAMSIVDRFNQIGNDFAITSKGIGDALMKSASALSVAGNTIDESVALITAANEVVN